MNNYNICTLQDFSNIRFHISTQLKIIRVNINHIGKRVKQTRVILYFFVLNRKKYYSIPNLQKQLGNIAYK